MKAAVLNSFRLNLGYAHGLVKDVSDERMCLQPGGVTNHAAFVLGHLAATCDFGLSMLGRPGLAPKEWEAIFGTNAKPTTDRAKYPGKAALLKALEDGHAALAAAFEKADAPALAKQIPHEGFRNMCPTIGDAQVFIMTAHEATHLGQLSAWRRALGLPSVY